MRITHDHTVDAVYIYLRDVPYAFGHSLDYERRIDYGEDEKPMGVELLGVSHGVNLDGIPEADAIERALAERDIRTYHASAL
ncbi:MAG TPA: DUF2283 domain-containing protein [Chloroflexota bacterium]|nr:DUF2283 domain-containing protein [Chloroflexota bacterium]